MEKSNFLLKICGCGVYTSAFYSLENTVMMCMKVKDGPCMCICFCNQIQASAYVCVCACVLCMGESVGMLSAEYSDPDITADPAGSVVYGLFPFFFFWGVIMRQPLQRPSSVYFFLFCCFFIFIFSVCFVCKRQKKRNICFSEALMQLVVNRLREISSLQTHIFFFCVPIIFLTFSVLIKCSSFIFTVINLFICLCDKLFVG